MKRNWVLVLLWSCCLPAAVLGTVKIVGDATDYVTITNAIVNAVAGDVIRATTGTYVEVFDIIDTTLTIDGKYDTGCVAKVAGATRLEMPASKMTPVILIDNSAATLIDLDITEGIPPIGNAAPGGGVLIRDGGSVRMQGCRVFNNVANGFGGGIYVTNSALVLTNCVVVSNRAVKATGGGYVPEGRGGGVAVDNGSLEIYGSASGGTDASIKWNAAGHMGGGIYVANGSSCLLSNETVDVFFNHATNGGGIAVENASRLDVVNNPDVCSNTAVLFGGGIYLESGSTGVVKGGATYIGYNAPLLGANVASNGGAFCVRESRLFVGTGARVAHNRAGWSGGGIFAESNSVCVISNAYIGNPGDFDHTNEAVGGYGGGVYLRDDSSLWMTNGALIHGCIAQRSGGGIYVPATCFLGLNNSTVRWNTIRSPAYGGGGICAFGSVTGENASIHHNVGGWSGGGMLALADVTLGQVAIVSNTAPFGGGLNWAPGGPKPLVLTGGRVAGNDAIALGGGMYLYGGGVALTNVEVSGNSAERGGGLYISNCTVEIRADGGAATIWDNSATEDGGGVFGGNCTAVFDGVGISNNVATWSGGGICWAGGAGYMLSMTNSTVWRNVAGLCGGGVALSAPAQLVDGSISINYASNHGGGLFVSNAAATIDGVYFESNQAGRGGGQGDGGGIFVGYGGAAALRSSVRSVLINNNTAVNGGGLFGTQSATVTLFKGGSILRFNGNDASVDGGGIGLYESTLTATGAVVVRGGLALHDGGGLYADRSTVRLFGSVVVGDADTNLANRAGHYGGGLAASSSTVLLGRVTFLNNVASNFSGGADLLDSWLSGTNVLFAGNQALVSDGGAMYGEGSVAILRGATFTNNRSSSSGGAIGWDSRPLSLTDCRVGDNRSANGGGIHLITADAYFGGVTVDVNRATEAGGGILMQSDSRLYATNLVLLGNTANSGDGGGLRIQSQSEAWLYGTNGMTVISSNAAHFGGGVGLSNGLVSISGKAWIEGNAATNGAGLYIAAGTAQVVNAYIVRNVAGLHGGGAYVAANAAIEMATSLLAENVIDPDLGWGGGLRLNGGRGYLGGCTVFSNVVGGVECAIGSALQMAGCIAYGHSLVNITAGYTVDYCDVGGGYLGTDNYDAEPRLLNGNYHLSAWSPCRDAGWLVMGEPDVDGEQRYASYDTGFDEFVDGDADNLPDVVETDTGVWANDGDMGTDPGVSDSDDDGIKDGDEWLADTDPNNAASSLRFTNIYMNVVGGLSIRWVGGTNAARRFEVAEDFHLTNSPTWEVYSSELSPTPGNGGENTLFWTNCAAYRLRASRFGF